MRDPRGEAQCPRCGSTDLTYKNVFDYFKCNSCRITFITPVYSYGEEQMSGLDSAKDVASKIFGEKQPEADKINKKPPESVTKQETPVAVSPGSRKNGTSWLTISLVAVVIVLALVIVWLLFGTEITDFISGLA